jgi:hypothetical protein
MCDAVSQTQKIWLALNPLGFKKRPLKKWGFKNIGSAHNCRSIADVALQRIG